MTTTKSRIVRAIAVLAASVMIEIPAMAQNEIIYNNTGTPLNSAVYNFGLEIGDQVTVSGQNRFLTQFQLEYYAALTPAPEKQALVRMYANDGAGGSPGTLLYESNPFTLANSYNTVTISSISGVALPETFTWTFVENGLAASEKVGLLAYSPPTVGSSGASYWQKNSFGVWTSTVLSDGTPGNFSAKITAVPEPTAIQLCGLAGLVWAGLAMYRRRS